jgi:hypothetical protein
MAIACAIEKRSSTVMIFPFDNTMSGGDCCAATSQAAAAIKSNPEATAALEVKRFIDPPWMFSWSLI